MKIAPISNSTLNFVKSLNFKGKMTDYQINNGIEDLSKNSNWHSNADVENTVGVFHKNYTGKVYFADPLEPISDKIKESVDYVVHDHEPKFPDIDNEVSKLYFFPQNKTNKEKEYASAIDKYREYFYRLEMADSRTVGDYEREVWHNNNPLKAREKADYFKAHVNDAKYNQETSATCLNILNESKDIRAQKDFIYNQIEGLENQIKSLEEELPKAKKELSQRKSLDAAISSRLAMLKEKEYTYDNLDRVLMTSTQKMEQGINDTAKAYEYNKINHPGTKGYYYKDFLAKPVSTSSYGVVNEALNQNKAYEIKKEMAFVKEQKDVINKSRAFYNAEASKNNSYIKKIEQYIEELPRTIQNLRNELVNKKQDFEKIKADLIPHFDKLKNYFYSRGLKNIK